MNNVILSANLKYLIDTSKKQFSQNKGLHLNSADWDNFVEVGPVQNYSFLINGDLKWHTNSKISGERYTQVMKLSDYKELESSLMIYFLLEVNESDIIELIKNFLYISNCRINCECKAFLYWGSKYNLTKIKSNYGQGESRFPKVRDPIQNNLVCKHLYLIFKNLDTEMNKFIKNLLPYYKRYLGIGTNKSIERIKKELGEKGIRRLVATSEKNILNTKNKDLINKYHMITNGKLNTLFLNEKDTNEIEKERDEN